MACSLHRHVRRAGLSRRTRRARPAAPGPTTRSRTAVVFHLLAALRHRDRTGEGQWIDASMGETVIGETPEWYMDYFMNGRDRRQWANRDDVMAPHNTYPCAGDDKWIAIAVGNDAEWHALCEVMGNPAWAREAKFADQFARWQNSDALDAHLREWTRDHEHIELAERLQRAGVAGRAGARQRRDSAGPPSVGMGLLVGARPSRRPANA